MTTIFLDASATREPGAADRLVLLAEAGHELVLVAPADAVGPAVAWDAQVPAVPAELPEVCWFVTADPATCGDRRAGLRTILVGPPRPGPRPTRCDQTARDLRDAVLVILAADVMR